MGDICDGHILPSVTLLRKCITTYIYTRKSTLLDKASSTYITAGSSYPQQPIMIAIRFVRGAFQEQSPVRHALASILRVTIAQLTVVVQKHRELHHHQLHLRVIGIVRLDYFQDIRDHLQHRENEHQSLDIKTNPSKLTSPAHLSSPSSASLRNFRSL